MRHQMLCDNATKDGDSPVCMTPCERVDENRMHGGPPSLKQRLLKSIVNKYCKGMVKSAYQAM